MDSSMVGQQIARRRRRDDAEVAVSGERGDAPAQRPLQVALLDEEGLEHVLDGFGVLADGMREVVEADRAAGELLDHREQQLAVHEVEPEHVDVEHLERGLGDRLGHGAVRLHLRVVAHAAQDPVGDARRAARAAGDFDRAVVIERHLQQARGAAHDRRQLVLAVELQARDDAEAVAQGVGQHAGTRGGAGKRERRQIALDRARRWALADHDVDLEVLERGVEDLLDYRRQAVNLVDEQHVLGSRFVSRAARSPGRSRTGPEVWRRLTPISRAMMCASVVLPSPGGPNSSTWSSASPRARAAWMKISSWPRIFSWPTYSARVAGRSERSNCSSWAEVGLPEISRSVSTLTPAFCPRKKRAAEPPFSLSEVSSI